MIDCHTYLKMLHYTKMRICSTCRELNHKLLFFLEIDDYFNFCQDDIPSARAFIS